MEKEKMSGNYALLLPKIYELAKQMNNGKCIQHTFDLKKYPLDITNLEVKSTELENVDDRTPMLEFFNSSDIEYFNAKYEKINFAIGKAYREDNIHNLTHYVFFYFSNKWYFMIDQQQVSALITVLKYA